jgi:hypothetical protein
MTCPSFTTQPKSHQNLQHSNITTGKDSKSCPQERITGPATAKAAAIIADELSGEDMGI